MENQLISICMIIFGSIGFTISFIFSILIIFENWGGRKESIISVSINILFIALIIIGIILLNN